jgi:hypothetical protein|tara:strand:+ start:1062 stop:1235 length:174 start_codon:yes stop_codon:yes gene_type:complete
MKTNFRSDAGAQPTETNKNSELTKEEFEKFVLNSGAKGSFMIYRSKNKDDELGIEEL